MRTNGRAHQWTSVFTPRRDVAGVPKDGLCYQKVAGVGSLCHCTARCGTLKEGAGSRLD